VHQEKIMDIPRENAPTQQPSASVKGLGRVLSIDYGRKRIGLALSDELQLTAQPLAILLRRNRQDDIHRLRELCRKHRVSRIVVGHPLHLTGSESEMSGEASRFAARLGKHLGIPVDLVEERLTSWDAEQTRNTAQLSARRGRPLDDIAAAIILRDYLQKRPILETVPTASGAS
jgi:putative holliday junction resolvase